MKIQVEMSAGDMKLIELAKQNNVNVSRDTLAVIGDIFLSNLTLENE